jgi:hypothetical protein
MISLKSFIEGINAAILSANNMLMARNEELLDTYFEPVPPKTGAAADDHHKHNTLRAKSICLEYPEQTEKGITTTHVDVPLVTLVPVSFPQIEKVKFTAQFDIQEINDELQIHFTNESSRRKRRWSWFGRTHVEEENHNSGKLEITIVPTQGPEGVKRVIEGYEKALRAQIPH